MDLQPRNVAGFIMIMIIIMMVLRFGLHLVESVESGFGEKKPQIGARESVRVLCDVTAVRCVQ